MNTPFNIKEKAYEKQNRKMRSEYKSETGKTLGKRLTKGVSKRRVSFACRFAGMAGAMKDAKGEPTKKAMALKKWGCLLYTSPSPRDRQKSRMPSSA